ncbi:phospholipase D beta 1-like [Mercurialis annua]|uniref:phospholipase D beta 1-like n=1 Tax=Mercurialis annua TaxID=3986 RepID=UPI002160FED6|nr:phospholipase D beta 1-like [Mercurialis annua]
MAKTVIDHTFSYGGSQHMQTQQELPFRTNSGSMKVLLLHGFLEIFVQEAKNLPNIYHKTSGNVLSKLTTKVTKKIERHVSTKITTDPYVTVSVSGSVVGTTFVIPDSENPVWMQHFDAPVAHYASEVHFIVKHNDVLGSEIVGAVGISAQQICSGMKIEGRFPILGVNGNSCKPSAELSLSIQFTPVEQIAIYKHGVGSGPDYDRVPGTYFPLRRGGKVTLYQDAHVQDDSLPNVRLDGHVQYEHGTCWLDIFNAIDQAQRLIYITGWSLYHLVRLVRDGQDGKDCTLGDLLKVKSEEGARVLLLVWDDPSSWSILGNKMGGVMKTNDEETRQFFKHSSVKVLLCPRSAGEGHNFMRKREVGTIYTHHQKTVTVDADAGDHKRKIIAFVGGLDICKGRYDTPDHSLFRTLETVHRDDFHNPTLAEFGVGCLRQPWHDLHCKIEGPAAYDVLKNFEERWLRASKPRGIHKLKGSSFEDSLLRYERNPQIIGIAEASCQDENDPECWHVQVFRSIDSSSVEGFPDDPKDAPSRNLLCGKNVLIDMSIHTAYVKAIRAAQSFIYIENQYFIGSSYNWDDHEDLGANNLIPMEIALKIASKIRANERFSAYILIPMWPESVPTGFAEGSILYWQSKTMQMMYETIYKALVEKGLENTFEPQDYLNFFCLGNREAFDPENSCNNAQDPNAANNPQALSQKNRRFQIYIHSKGMIADDEYVIIGSANINQRSMAGTRDTEIAMGAYQPHHTLASQHYHPRGQIYGYRMSLWAEHIGGLEECFEKPETLECIRRVRFHGEMNWKQYASDEVTEMKGHLLKYPVEVDRTGKVGALLGSETFPDVGGNILGSFTGIRENLTI